MELANWVKADTAVIRTATPNDRSDIYQLMRTAAYYHVHLDWRPAVDWLGHPGFVVQSVSHPTPEWTTKQVLFPSSDLEACLAVTDDPAPAAWVRLVCLRQASDPVNTLTHLLDAAILPLMKMGIEEIGWLAIEPWPNRWLSQIGFNRIHEIETFHKDDLMGMDMPSLPGLTIRPICPEDMERLAEIEVAAFAPLWRHSPLGFSYALRQAFSFHVAEWYGRIVGFQFSTRSDNHAHLARMTVDPTYQGHGIGRALLIHALEDYRRHGLRHISLNTQTDNLPSQRLYRKFGFKPTGQRFPVWCRNLNHAFLCY